MTEKELTEIALRVASETKFWIALIGVIGALIGSLLTILGNITVEWYKGRDKRKTDSARQRLLEDMLKSDSHKWRDLSTLSLVIGCSHEETKKHLIQIGARGSESGSGAWGLISRNPLP